MILNQLVYKFRLFRWSPLLYTGNMPKTKKRRNIVSMRNTNKRNTTKQLLGRTSGLDHFKPFPMLVLPLECHFQTLKGSDTSVTLNHD